MKNLALIAVLFVLLTANLNAEIVTPGSVIDISAQEDKTSSLDIKDIVKADLLRPYGEDEFQIDVNKLPSVNDDPYLLTKISEKPIVITQDELTISDKGIKFINGNAFLMPLTKYTLAKNLRIKTTENRVKIEDSKLSFQTDKAIIKDGVVYLGENEIPLKIMPNMILNDLIGALGEKNVKRVEIESGSKEIKYSYIFNVPAKLLFFFDTSMDINIIVDASTGKHKIKKPIWALFASGEESAIQNYNFTNYAAF